VNVAGERKTWRRGSGQRLRQLGRVLNRCQWQLVVAIALAVTVLGYLGFREHLSALSADRSFTSTLYLTLQLFVLGSGAVSLPIPWELDLARFLAPVLPAYATAKVLGRIFFEQFHELRLRAFRDHVVICGLGRRGLALAKAFLDQGLRVVAIEADGASALVAEARAAGAIILFGRSTSAEVLRRAGVDRAAQLVAVHDEDGDNAEIAIRVSETVKGRTGRPLICQVHIVDPLLCNLLRERQVVAGRTGSVLIEFYNTYESAARALLDESDPFRSAELRGQPPHLLVAGAGRLGQALVANAARDWRARRGAPGVKLRITLADPRAGRVASSLRHRYPRLDEYCELIPLEVDVRSAAFQRGDPLHHEGRCDITAVYVCLSDDSLSLFTGLALARSLQSHRIPVVARVAEETGLATLVQGLHTADVGGTFSPFAFFDRTCGPQLLPSSQEALARAIHETYVACRREQGQDEKANPAIRPWQDLPDDLRQSNYEQAQHTGSKLRAISCAVTSLLDWDAPPFALFGEEVELLARMEHERFLQERKAAGWRLGHPKDLARKRSPALVPWDQLSEEEREFNRCLIRQLPNHLVREGFQVYRVPSGQ